MRRYWFPKRYADQVARMRVAFGFVLVLTFAWLSHPSRPSLLTGLPLSLAGLLLRAWAAGHLAKNQQLARFGPYAHTRNPLYVGTLLVALGLVIAGRSVWLAAIFAAIFLLIYLPVIELEEQHLRSLFPAYPEFAEHVPVLFPRFSPAATGGKFCAALYVRNREYQALLGWILGAGFLVGKFLFHA